MSPFKSSTSSDRRQKLGLIFTINHIVREVEVEVGLDEVGARARAILLLIGEKNASGAAPRLIDVIVESGLGSAPTIYASLRELETGGWIVRHTDDSDARARRLYVTARAEHAFVKMSELVGIGSLFAKRDVDYINSASDGPGGSTGDRDPTD